MLYIHHGVLCRCQHKTLACTSGMTTSLNYNYYKIMNYENTKTNIIV